MAKILKFRPTETIRPEGDAMADEPSSAEVIVFPGVRYERWEHADEDEASPNSATKRRSRGSHRDVLELAE